MRPFIKYAISALLTTIILAVFIVFSVSNITSNSNKISVYEDTEYDFFVTGFLNNTESTNLLLNENVQSSVKFYNFLLDINGTTRGNVLLTPDIARVNQTFFNQDIIIEGAYTEGKGLVDTIFATKYNLSVGDYVNFRLNGYDIQLQISGIFLSSDISSFENGILIAEWMNTYNSFYNNELIYDIVFINAINISEFQNYLTTSRYSYIARTESLNDVLVRSLPSIRESNLNIIISSIFALLVQGFVVFVLLRRDSKRISINSKEKNHTENAKYQKVITLSALTSSTLLIIVVLLGSLPSIGDASVIIIISSIIALVAQGFIIFVSFRKDSKKIPINSKEKNNTEKIKRQKVITLSILTASTLPIIIVFLTTTVALNNYMLNVVIVLLAYLILSLIMGVILSNIAIYRKFFKLSK